LVVIPWDVNTNTQIGSGYNVIFDYGYDETILFPLLDDVNWGLGKFNIHLGDTIIDTPAVLSGDNNGRAKNGSYDGRVQLDISGVNKLSLSYHCLPYKELSGNYFRNLLHPNSHGGDISENSVVYWCAMGETSVGAGAVGTNKIFDININDLAQLKSLSKGWYRQRGDFQSSLTDISNQYPNTFGETNKQNVYNSWNSQIENYNEDINSRQAFDDYYLPASKITIGNRTMDVNTDPFNPGLKIKLFDLVINTSAKLCINFDYDDLALYPGFFHIIDLSERKEMTPETENGNTFFNINELRFYPYLNSNTEISLRYTSLPYIGYDTMGNVIVNLSHNFGENGAETKANHQLMYYWGRLVHEAWVDANKNKIKTELKDLKNVQIFLGYLSDISYDNSLREYDIPVENENVPAWLTTDSIPNDIGFIVLKKATSTEELRLREIMNIKDRFPLYFQADEEYGEIDRPGNIFGNYIKTIITSVNNGYVISVDYEYPKYSDGYVIPVHRGWNIIGTYLNYKDDNDLIDLNNVILEGRVLNIDTNNDYSLLEDNGLANIDKNWKIGEGTAWIKCRENNYLIYDTIKES